VRERLREVVELHRPSGAAVELEDLGVRHREDLLPDGDDPARDAVVRDPADARAVGSARAPPQEEYAEQHALLVQEVRAQDLQVGV
jgi:hypothetical protein